MKQTRYLLVILIVLITTIILTGCASVVESPRNQAESDIGAISPNQFVIIEDYGDFYTMYHKGTKVMYAVSDRTYNTGNVTLLLLVDAEGKPLLYEE